MPEVEGVEAGMAVELAVAMAECVLDEDDGEPPEAAAQQPRHSFNK
jgi:hypothetical protein